ncbi:MAG TPA: hypothetical protein VFA07_14360 [Chthonomonadaceae bacterium]|nr:hypothetical protein [Chthonomonadaceae bacterium]
MKRNILVRVYDSHGKPAYYARVNIFISMAGIGGGNMEKYTNHDGEVEFVLDGYDEHAQISVSVNGSEKYQRGPIRGEYRCAI